MSVSSSSSSSTVSKESIQVRIVERIIAVVVIPLCLFIVSLGLAFGSRDHLPQPIATHWGFDSIPDGSTDSFSLFVCLTTIYLLLWLVPCVEWAVRGNKARRIYSIVPVSYILGLILSIGIGDVVANWGAVDWESAKGFSPYCICLLAILSAVLGFTAYFIETDYSPFYITPIGEYPSCLPDQTHAVHRKDSRPNVYTRHHGREKAKEVWRGQAHNWWILFFYVSCLSVLAVLIGLVAGATDGSAVVLVCLLTCLFPAIVIVFAVIGTVTEVRIYERSGIVISTGRFRILQRKIHFAQISTISATRISPFHDFGGYGIKRKETKTCYAIRSGEAIQFLLPDNARDVIVTIDNMHAGVEVACRELAAFRSGLPDVEKFALEEVKTQGG